MKFVTKLLVTFLALTFCVRAQTLRVAAAADLQFAMSDLTAQYQKQSGTKIIVTYGSSGNFQAQIANGAPFDLFFSADTMYPKQLVKTGAADAASLRAYAQGHLVLWALTGSNLHLQERGFDALKDPHVQKIAIANPEHAPYGRAAVAALQKVGLYNELQPKLVLGENISQTAQFTQSGSAQIGMIALSLTFAPSMKGGELWEIPSKYYPPILQDAVVVSSSPNKVAANAFLNFVKSQQGRDILAKYGFTAPQPDAQP
jgi:molybdate transport system substrate-binding protein